MGTYQITHIRVSDDNATSTDKITDVKLAGNYKDCTVSQIIEFLEKKHDFFYTISSQQIQSFVEVATSSLGNKYIRSIANATLEDNLLKLPRF